MAIRFTPKPEQTPLPEKVAAEKKRPKEVLVDEEQPAKSSRAKTKKAAKADPDKDAELF